MALIDARQFGSDIRDFARREVMGHKTCDCDHCVLATITLDNLDNDENSWLANLANHESEFIREFLSRILNACNRLIIGPSNSIGRNASILLASLALRGSQACDPELVSLACSYVGAAFQETGQVEVALEYLLRSIAGPEPILGQGNLPLPKVQPRRRRAAHTEQGPAAILIRICSVLLQLGRNSDAAEYAIRSVRAACHERSPTLVAEAACWQIFVRNSLAYCPTEETEVIEITALLRSTMGSSAPLDATCFVSCHELRRQGRYVDAVQSLARVALGIAATGVNPTCGHFVKGCADQLLRLGHVRDAEPLYAEALQLWQLVDAHWAMAASYQGLGSVNFRLDRHAAALSFNQLSQKLYEGVGDLAAQGRIRSNDATIYAALGDSRAAMEAFEQSIDIMERSGPNQLNGEYIGRAYLGMGALYVAQYDLDKGRAALKLALERSEPTGDRSLIAQCLNMLGSVHTYGEHHAEAIEYFEIALKLATGCRDLTMQLVIRMQRAYSLTRMGEARAASEDLEECGRIAETLNVPSLIANCEVRIGFARRGLGQPEAALKNFHRAVTIRKQIGSADRLYEAYRHLAACYNQIGNMAEAVTSYCNAVAFVEKASETILDDRHQSTLYFESCMEVFHQLIAILVSAGNVRQALEYAERSKAHALRAAWRKQHGRSVSRPGNRAARAPWDEALNSEFREWSKGFSDTNSELLNFVASRLIDGHADDNNAHSQTGLTPPSYACPATFKTKYRQDVFAHRDCCDAKSVALEFVVMPDRICLLVATQCSCGEQLPGRIAAHWVTASPAEIQSNVKLMQEALAEGTWAFDGPSRFLYQQLIAPIETFLDGQITVLIVPDDFLWELSFQALIDANGRYLIEKCAVMYAPSISALAEFPSPYAAPVGETQRGDNRKTALVVANPLRRGDPNPLPSLPETEAQARSLMSFYGPEQCVVLTGEVAQSSAVLSAGGGFRILHFAVHGLFDNEEPLRSSLLFADTPAHSVRHNRDFGDGAARTLPNEPESENSILTAKELMGIRLSAELVILAACDSGRGRGGSGEGLVGLAWALAVAGCPRTVASQWAAYSASAGDLLVDLHVELAKRSEPAWSSVEIAAALQKAAMGMLAGGNGPQYRHPHYWAPFILVSCSW